MVNIFILGPAGSGKTTLTEKFGKYLEEQGFSVGYINLDAAVEKLPYHPNFDIRNYYTVDDVMRKFNIGPNTALIRSVELLLSYRDEIKKIVSELLFDKDYIIIDTPGQLELVVFHSCGIEILKIFEGKSCTVFLIPADLLRSIRDFAFLKLLALAIKYRINMPIVTVISKADMLSCEAFQEVLSRKEDLLIEGVQADLTLELWNIIDKLEKKQRIIRVSSLTGEGLEDLHTIIHEVFCTCGDLT